LVAYLRYCIEVLFVLYYVFVITYFVFSFFFFFFFKQKTAYEIGLGIPAEPLFRSTLFPYSSSKIGRAVQQVSEIMRQMLTQAQRSEERRVGKECRSRWSAEH